jgi:UDP-N-acetylenolpyruvoylglucosamine reductase
MSALSLLLDAGKIENVPNFRLSDASTFRVGGTAEIAIFPRGESEFAEVLAACAKDGIRTEIIGGGSNVVFPERFDGAVIFQKIYAI